MQGNEYEAFIDLEHRLQRAKEIGIQGQARVISLFFVQHNGDRQMFVMRGKD